MMESRARDTSIRISESIKTEFKTPVSEADSLFEVFGYKLRNRANLDGLCEYQQTPASPLCVRSANFRTFPSRLHERVRRLTIVAALNVYAVPSTVRRSNTAEYVS